MCHFFASGFVRTGPGMLQERQTVVGNALFKFIVLDFLGGIREEDYSLLIARSPSQL
jgi:hypothetical protein